MKTQVKKSTIRKIIKEELARVMNEGEVVDFDSYRSTYLDMIDNLKKVILSIFDPAEGYIEKADQVVSRDEIVEFAYDWAEAGSMSDQHPESAIYTALAQLVKDAALDEDTTEGYVSYRMIL